MQKTDTCDSLLNRNQCLQFSISHTVNEDKKGGSVGLPDLTP